MQVHVLHCILSGDFFRVWREVCRDFRELHRDLLAAWVSLTIKLDLSFSCPLFPFKVKLKGLMILEPHQLENHLRS